MKTCLEYSRGEKNEKSHQKPSYCLLEYEPPFCDERIARSSIVLWYKKGSVGFD